MRRVLFSFLLAWIALGCSNFDTTRVAIARGTLGEEIVRVLCERMASEAHPEDVSGLAWKPVCRGQEPPPASSPRRLVVLMEHRAQLVAALDRALPESVHDDLGHFLGQLLPLYDPPAERLPRNTRLFAEFLDRLSGDDEALDALARIGTREGYRPLRLGLGVTRALLAYPELDTLAGSALRTLTDLPSDDTDGTAAAEWRALQAALALEMATLEPSEPGPSGEPSTLELARDLMFTERDPFAAIGGSPRWSLVRDRRGLALPAGGVVAPPLTDRDGDGLADVDATGRFVGPAGEFVEIVTPFALRGEIGVPRDTGGRALRADATRYWEYRDVDRTLLAGLLRESGALFDPASPALLSAARGLPALLGSETALTETYGVEAHAYTGPHTAGGSLFDVVYALGEMMHRDSTDRALALTEILLRDHEAEIAGVLGAAESMIDRGDAYPDARLAQPNVLWDDLIARGVEYSQTPGLVDALLRSFADPRSAGLGDVIGGMMRHRDAITFDPASPNATPLGFPLDDRVDRAVGDVRGNESLWQRTIALIDGLDGVRVCNREGARLTLDVPILGSISYPLFGGAAECELIDIPNVAEAYALSILGEYELEIQGDFLRFIVDAADAIGIPVDNLIEDSSGIVGMTRRPTPQALNRLVFWGLADDDGDGTVNCDFCGDLFDRVRDRHGNDVMDTYPGTIGSWEAPGFYSGMTPLIAALHDPRFRHAPDGTYRFGQLMRTLHLHWASPEHWLTQSASPAAPNFSHHDDARSYEEAIADGFVDARMIERMQALQVVVDTVEIDGRDGITVLAEATADLIDPALSPGLTTRDGRTTIPWNDGSAQHAVSPLLLLLEGLRNMDRDLEAQPERREAWRSGRGALARHFLGARRLGEGYLLANERAREIVLTILPFVRDRLAAHRTAGDLIAWSRELTTDTEELLSSPLVYGLVRLLGAVADDPAALDALTRLLAYLLDERSENDAFASTLFAASDLLMLLDDEENILPIAHALSRALAPNAPEVVATGAEELDLEASAASDALGLVREIQGLDDRRTLPVLLSNLVRLDESAGDITPLEDILDVMSEINRADPGGGGSFVREDYQSLFGHVTGALTDEVRGLERLYDVVQAREVP
jgi:hypothetical protein